VFSTRSAIPSNGVFYRTLTTGLSTASLNGHGNFEMEKSSKNNKRTSRYQTWRPIIIVSLNPLETRLGCNRTTTKKQLRSLLENITPFLSLQIEAVWRNRFSFSNNKYWVILSLFVEFWKWKNKHHYALGTVIYDSPGVYTVSLRTDHTLELFEILTIQITLLWKPTTVNLLQIPTFSSCYPCNAVTFTNTSSRQI